ncbi:MAG TPA: sigma-70 family RNA polymerase sigma factor [Tenuifilaceae bacterium]|nr:sigma-70 family RNA polymerase sigma factor [Tenuifilaceae bacterium]
MRNDRKAQQALYGHYSARMYGVCLRYYPNVAIAQDILQDGFIKVFENIHSFRFEGSIEGWIRRIIINTALEYHRKIKDEKMVVLSDALLLSQEPLSVDIDYRQLLLLISELPNQYRMVFNLYAIEGYSHAEIAKMLAITESTSKSNYSRARAILREKVNKIADLESHAVL